MTDALMSAETWRAFCMAILSMKPPAAGEDTPERVEKPFRCEKCGMEWKTAIPLDGMRHLAIQNKCGGVWRLSKAEVQG